MKNLLTAAGFSTPQQQESLVQHLYLSGAFGIDLTQSEAIVESFGLTQEELEQQRNSLLSAVENSPKKENGEILTEELLNTISTTQETGQISDKYLLAITLAGYQRHFIAEPVVAFLNPTQYCESQRDNIDILAQHLGMKETERVNLEPSENSQQITTGLSIGATCLTMADYLQRHKRIAQNRPDPSQPYQLFTLEGPRTLISAQGKIAPSDNLYISDGNIDSLSKENTVGSESYITFLARKNAVDETAVTEAMAMKHLSSEILKETNIVIQPVEARTAEDFFYQSMQLSQGTNLGQTALTSVQPFHRTYEAMVKNAASSQAVDMEALFVDGGSPAQINPTAIMKETAKLFNTQYHNMAHAVGIENPVPKELLQGGNLKKILPSASIATSEEKTESLKPSGKEMEK